MSSAVDIGTKLLDEQAKRHIAELTRLSAQQTVLVKALNNISRLTPTLGTNGRTDWVHTCGEMRLIAAKALATLDVPEEL